MIEQIRIRNFKSIRELDLELRSINILIGANGAGKSNFISFLKLVNKLYEGQLQTHIAQQAGIDNLLYFGQKSSDYLSGLIDFENTNAYYFVLHPSQNNRAYFGKEGDFFNYNKDSEKQYRAKWHEKLWKQGHEESKIKESKEGRAGYIKKFLSGFKVYHFHDTSVSSKMKQIGAVDDNHFLREDGSNLAAYLYRLQEKESKKFKQITATIRSIAPFFDRFDLKPSALDSQKIQLEWQEKNSDMYLNVHHLSDGTLRMIALTTLLLQPNPPKTILIDEPELGLHPFAIHKLAGLLRKASAKSQIIVSTQSVNLVDQFSPEDIVTVDRQDNQSVFHRLNAENLTEWLEKYTLGDLWSKNIIGGQP